MAQSHVNEDYLSPCTKLLKEVHYPHIEIMSEETLTAMLFANGPDRLEALKWMFIQINPEQDFSENKLKDELIAFAVNFGLCSQKEVKQLVLGEPEAPVKRQSEFWRLVLETVRDVQNYNLETPNRGDFLYEVAKSGTLEALISSVNTVNICPALLTSSDLKKVQESVNPDVQLAEIMSSLQKLKEEVAAQYEDKNKKAAVHPADLMTQIDGLSKFLEDNKTCLDGLASSLSKPADLDTTDEKLKLSLEEAAASCQPAIKILEEQTILQNLSKDFPPSTSASLDIPDILKELDNNVNDA